MSTSTKKINTLNGVVKKALEQFKSLTKYPEDYLEVQSDSAHTLRDVTKGVYDISKDTEQHDKCLTSGALPKLLTQGFDDEQIWQEIELQNDPVIKHLLRSSAKLGIIKPHVSFNVHLAEPETSRTKGKSPKKKKSSNKKSKNSIKVQDLSLIDDNTGENDGQTFTGGGGSGESDSDSDAEITRIKASLKLGKRAQVTDPQDSSDSEIAFNFPKDELDDENVDGHDDDLSQNDSPKGKKKKKNEFDEEEFSDNGDDDVGKASLKASKAKQPSIVDDKFFRLSLMEWFLEQEDKREQRKQQKEENYDDEDGEDGYDEGWDDDDDVDMFVHLSSDEEGGDKEASHSRNMKYDEFFDAPQDELAASVKKSVRFEQETKKIGKTTDVSQPETSSSKRLLDDDSDGEDVADVLGIRKETPTQSTFEKRQQRLKEQITQMEDASLLDKPWQLMGEAAAATRPENSLLEEHLQFDHTARLPPVVTEETTKTLEEIIQQRIKDKAWDDVDRKIKPTEDPLEYKKRIVLDQEKSKLSLSQIYEQEYIKQQQAEEDAEEKKDDAEHEEIKKLMKYLFTRLDALSNFHYTPKPAIPELQIVSNLPSIRMEEVAPVSMTDVQRLAPEELEAKQKGELKGTTEKTTTDRKRERREKKASKRTREKEKLKKQKLIDKLHPGLGNKYSKEKAMKDLEKQSHGDQNLTVLKDSSQKSTKSSLTSSKAFFTQLQQEVTSQISRKRPEAASGVKKKQKTSKNFKL